MDKITITVDVDKDIADIITRLIDTRDGDIFHVTYGIGYWGYGVPIGRAARSGWLIYEPEQEGDRPTDKQERAAKTALKSGQPLPERWHLLDEGAAKRVVAEGLKRFGHKRFIDDNDLPIMDEAIQWALLGEQRYG